MFSYLDIRLVNIGCSSKAIKIEIVAKIVKISIKWCIIAIYYTFFNSFGGYLELFL